MTSGNIIKWVDEKGYGFIRCEDSSEDIFVHISAFGNLVRTPRVGDVVVIEELATDKGKQKAIRAQIEGMKAPYNRKSKPLLIASILISLLFIYLVYSQF